MDSYGDNSALQDRRRNRAELTMSQNIGQNLRSLMLSAVREDYWNSGKTMESYSAGYNNASEQRDLRDHLYIQQKRQYR